MSFLSGLSNIFHGIGHIFDGGDDQQKKQQQQQSFGAPQTTFNSNNAPGQTVQPQAPQPTPAQTQALNLFQGPANTLQKAPNPLAYDPAKDTNAAFKGYGNFGDNGQVAETQTQQPAPQPAAQPQSSLLHKVVDFGKAVVHPFAEFGNAALHTPQAIYREVQNKPIDDIQRSVFGTNDSGTIAKKIIGDTASVGLALAAPGIGSAAEAGTSAAVAPEMTDTIINLVRQGIPYDVAKATAEKAAGTAIPNLVKYGSAALTGGAINTGFGGIQQAQQDGVTPIDLLKKVPENFGVGAALGVAGAGASDLFHGAQNLVKAGNDAPAEIAPGVKVSNANHLEDAVKQTTAPVEQPQVAVAPAEAAGKVAVEPQAPVTTPAELKVAQAGEQQALPLDQPAVPTAEAPAPATPAETLQPASAPPAEGTQTAPNAPQFRKGLTKTLGDVSKQVEKDGSTHEVLSNPELTAAGKAVVDNMPDEEVLSTYNKPIRFTSPGDLAQGHAALQRLSAIIRSGTPEAKAAAQDAINNIIDASSEVQSSGGRVLQYGQEMLNSLPPEAKVEYYIKHLDKLNEGVDGYHPLSEDPEAKAAVQANLMKFLIKDEQIASQIAEQKAVLEKAFTAETRGDVSVEELQQAKATADQLGLEQRQNAGEMTKYYDTLTPGRSTAEKFSDWQRTSMLSSPTGRAHAMLGTGFNVADQGAKDTVSGLLGKAYNAIVGPEKAVRDTGFGIKDVAKGAWTGLKKTVNEARGNFEVGNSLEKGLKNNSIDNSSEMNSFGGGTFKRLVNAATHSHSNVTEGIKDAQIVRDAHVEGTRAGLTGEELDKYTIARSASPTAMMTERATEAHAQINNLNNNPLTEALTKTAAAIAGDSPVGNVIKNQLLPFPRFVAGNIWNQVTDKNVVAAFVKTIGSATKGDAQGVIDNAAKLGVEGGKTYALGWLLTQHGIIVNHDANGKDYEGAYLHLGNRYIPVSTLGFVAPSLVIGNATYNAFNDPKTTSGSFLSHLGHSVSDSVFNMYKSVSGADVLGAGDSLVKPINQAITDKNPADLLKIGTNVVGQNIPAATGDANAILNQTNLNPTHEAAQTTVKTVNPDTGNEKTDPVATAKASLLNKVPFASQTLPRQAGVSSADLVDRTLHSTRDTPTTIQTRNDATTQANTSADLKAKGIPDPNAKYKTGDSFDNAIKNRIENGQYDQAIGGLNAQIDSLKKGPNPVPSEIKKIQDHVKELTVIKDSGFEPKTIDLYKNTSLSEWRNMGDPESDSYDPNTYNLLWRLDGALTKEGVSGNSADATNSKYSAKKPGKGKSGADAALKKITSNTLGSTPNMAKISFGDLAPRKVGTAPIPTIQQIKSGDLIKKRTISVGKVA